MKFYIVTSNRGEKIKCNVKDAYRYLDLNEAISEFNRFNRERRWRHSYLIVDFENFSRNDTNRVLKCSEDEYMLPYLMIGEYHNYADPDYSIRQDKLIIRHGGLSLEYENNLVAMRAFLGLLKVEPKLEMYIEYIVERFGKVGIKTQLVTAYNMNDTTKNPLKRFEIEPFTWEPAPMEARKLYLFDLSKDKDNTKIKNAVYSLTGKTEKEIEMFPM